MASVFENTTVNGMHIQNRIVRSATWEGACDGDGRPTNKTISYYQELAKGQVGLIISGYTFVLPEGKQQPGKAGIHRDDFKEDFQKLTGAVHQAKGTVAIQLVHAGGQANPVNSGLPSVAPSSIESPQYPQVPKELSVKEISRIVDAFAAGAKRAKAWGFDGIQLHGAHGYLINQFLSPLTNRRTDAYGGSLDNRCRFLFETYRAIRKEVGSDYPVMIKLNATDNLDGGLSMEDSLLVAKSLDQMGIDLIEVSSGTSASGKLSPARPGINAPEKEAYNLNYAKQMQNQVSCPVMVVGGFRSFDMVEKAITQEGMDYISMCRPFIWEPNLVARWKNGDRKPAKCTSCSRCFIPGQKGGIHCMVEEKQNRTKKS